ncbi:MULTISPECIES: hypothetical protein [unclassified Iodidimonas]|jgi:hypothetical protein|nr:MULTISPECIES: hypothetical protein [unclassified Iodidimonas]
MTVKTTIGFTDCHHGFLADLVAGAGWHFVKWRRDKLARTA